MNLFGQLDCRTNKILIVSELTGIKIKFVETSTKKLQDAEFLLKNPFGKLPVLEYKEGKYLFDSIAIMKYIVSQSNLQSLSGNNEMEKMQLDSILMAVNNEVEPVVNMYLSTLYGKQCLQNQQFKQVESDLESILKTFNQILALKTYLVAHNITIADIYLAQVLVPLFRFYFDAYTRKDLCNINRWFNNISHLAAFKSVNGNIHLCSKKMKVDLNINQQINAQSLQNQLSAQSQQQERQQKTQQQQQQPKKQQQQQGQKQQNQQQQKDKKSQQKGEQKLEQKLEQKIEEKIAVEEDKKKDMNSLDKLEPSKFNLFDFKTLFVNSLNKRETMIQFWNEFDQEGYSIYKIEYQKYEGEGEKVYLTNNLMNGFIQRLDDFRKYAFGVLGVYGDEPCLDIKGVMMWRGQGIPNEIKEHPSYEYYTFTLLNSQDADNRAIVEEYWCSNKEDQDKVQGQTLRTYKQFK